MSNKTIATGSGSQIIIYQAEDGNTKIDVRLENETVWLTQKLMAELFQTTSQNITLHLNNIYSEKELSKEATCKDFLQVQKEGERQVQRTRKFYNLDVIISVGYRIKSHVATRFRQWATRQLRIQNITMMGTSGQCQIVPDYAITGIIDSHLIRLRVNEKLILPTYFRLLIDESKYVRHQILMLGKGSIMHGLNSSIIKELLIILPPIKDQKSISAHLDHKTTQIDNLISKKQKLIELLKEERAAIINQAVTKGLNPDAPMKDSGIEWLGKIPVHWEVKRLKYVAKTIQTGTTPSSLKPEYFIDGEIDWFTPVDFGDSLFLSNSNRKLNRSAIDDNVARLYGSNTVLLVGIGATLGKVGIIKRTASSNQQINAISFKDDYNPDFGAYYFQAISDIIVSMSNAATLPILNQTQTKEIMVLVPPQKEQDEIVGFINQTATKIDQTISKIEKQIDLLKEFRTALISEVVTGKVDVRDEELK